MSPPDTLADLPLVLTVEQFATVLHLGRSTAYQQAKQLGLTVAIGRSVRIPRHRLAALLGMEDPTEWKGGDPIEARHAEEGSARVD